MHHTSGNESNKFYLIIRKAKKTQFHLGCRTNNLFNIFTVGLLIISKTRSYHQTYLSLTSICMPFYFCCCAGEYSYNFRTSQRNTFTSSLCYAYNNQNERKSDRTIHTRPSCTWSRLCVYTVFLVTFCSIIRKCSIKHRHRNVGLLHYESVITSSVSPAHFQSAAPCLMNDWVAEWVLPGAMV